MGTFFMLYYFKKTAWYRKFCIVIDGQQRLSTFSILLKVLYDRLDDRNKRDFDKYLFEEFTENEPKIHYSNLDKNNIYCLKQSDIVNKKNEAFLVVSIILLRLY